MKTNNFMQVEEPDFEIRIGVKGRKPFSIDWGDADKYIKMDDRDLFDLEIMLLLEKAKDLLRTATNPNPSGG